MKRRGLSLFQAQNRRAQTLYRVVFAVVFVALYVLLVKAFDLGSVWRVYGVSQLMVLVPLAILCCLCVYVTRWRDTARIADNDWRKENLEADAKISPQHHAESPHLVEKPNSPVADVKPRQDFPPPQSEASDSQDVSPDVAWERARNMPHSFIPHLEKDRDYLALVHRAAAGGHAEALAKLGDYALRRGANVEAYFWTAVAQKHGYAGVAAVLGKIRLAWMKAGASGEYDNVYDFFPETCGTVGRSLLRITCGIDVSRARQRLRELAAKGDAYAALFV